jgi:hypothetical protein
VNAEIVIRSVEWKDKDLIFSTWLRGQYWGSNYFLNMDQDEYFQDYAKRITRYISRPGTQIDCAVLKDAPEVVLGYIVYHDQHLFWAYVKRDYRKQGILNLLLKNMDFEGYSGHTKVGLAIAKKRNFHFNPLQEG